MTPQNDTHQRLHINRKEILNLNPMDKIKLRLCAGTMCYVMGGAQLMEIEEFCRKYTVDRKNTNSEKWDTGIEKNRKYTEFCS